MVYTFSKDVYGLEFEYILDISDWGFEYILDISDWGFEYILDISDWGFEKPAKSEGRHRQVHHKNFVN